MFRRRSRAIPTSPSRKPTRRPAGAARSRPLLEGLEDRLLLTTYAVTNANDSGPGSFRQAVFDANGHAGLDTIAFAIGSGAQTITPTSPLPAVTDPVVIDGTTQPGYAGTPLIALDGSRAGNSDAIDITAGGSTVRGLAIYGFGAAINLLTRGGNTVTGNSLGTNAGGSAALGNNYGIAIQGVGGNVIGGATAAARNVISANHNDGVLIIGAGATGNQVVNNYIGTNTNGTAAVPNGGVGVLISQGATGNTVGGLPAAATNLISGNRQYGVEITDPGTNGNVILGNYIGTNASGTAALGNGYSGVFVGQGAKNNQVGGTAAGSANVISGNLNDGVQLVGAGTTGNQVAGNYIGTNGTGTAVVPNAGSGVHFLQAATSNTAGPSNLISGNGVNGATLEGAGTAGNLVVGNRIGTTAAGAAALGNGNAGVVVAGGAAGNAVSNNLVSGNRADGIQLAGAGTSGNTLADNFVGTNAQGTAVVPNSLNGIAVFAGATNNTVGGTAAGAGNLVSGNGANGVGLFGSGTTGNRLLGNLIGTDLAGTAALGNAAAGVVVTDGAAGNTVGGTDPGARNLISGNRGDGVALTNGGTSANVVQGNYIGLNNAGTAAVPNAFSGVAVFSGAANNTVGGTAAGAGNVISGNTLYGVALFNGASGNQVQGNSIGTNPSGTAALGNGNAGVLLSLAATGNTVGGTVAGARNLISGNRQFGVLITDAGTNGNAVLGNSIGTTAAGTAALANLFSGVQISAGARTNRVGSNLISGNLNDGVQLAGAGTSGNQVAGNLIGTNFNGTAAVANAGSGVSVFQAATGNTVGGTDPGARNLISGNGVDGVLLSDSGTSGNLVQGNYVGTDGGGTAAVPNGNAGVVIGPAAGSNTVAGNLISGNTTDGVQIAGDGTSGNQVVGNSIGTDASGGAALPNGSSGVALFGGPSGNVIGGTDPGAGNLISGNLAHGVGLFGSGTTGNVVLGNRIGTDATGTVALGNGQAGVLIEDHAANNTVGGSGSGAGNLISGNGTDGVAVLNDGTTGNLVAGNLIGTDVTGTAALGNAAAGVRVADLAAGNTVGGTDAGAGNVVSANGDAGVVIEGRAAGNVVLGNRIGTDAGGTQPLGNTASGVVVRSDAANNLIGGTDPGAGNVIGFNGYDGVLLDGGSGNAVRGNAIFASANLGIELVNGANNNQGFPVLVAVSSDDSTVTVAGTVTGPADTTLMVDFFVNNVCNPSGYGEGEQYLGSWAVTTDDDGNGSFTATFAAAVAPGQFVTATATDADNNTSAFSACVPVPDSGRPGPTVPGRGLARFFQPDAGVGMTTGRGALPAVTVAPPSPNAATGPARQGGQLPSATAEAAGLVPAVVDALLGGSSPDGALFDFRFWERLSEL